MQSECVPQVKKPHSHTFSHIYSTDHTDMVSSAQTFYDDNTTACADHKLPHDHASDKKEEEKVAGRLQRAQWLRAAILGANDGLLSTTSLMLGVGAAKEDQWSMIISGLAGALAGACSMAVGEFVSVSTQRDIERAAVGVGHLSSNDHRKRPGVVMLENGVGGGDVVLDIISNSAAAAAMTPSRNFSSVVSTSPARSPLMKVVITDARKNTKEEEESTPGEDALPNPYKAAIASALSFLCGSLFPLLSAIVVQEHMARIVVIAVVTSISLVLFGAVGALLGGSPLRVSAARVLVGGWISMAITYSLIKPLDHITDKKEHTT